MEAEPADSSSERIPALLAHRSFRCFMLQRIQGQSHYIAAVKHAARRCSAMSTRIRYFCTALSADSRPAPPSCSAVGATFLPIHRQQEARVRMAVVCSSPGATSTSEAKLSYAFTGVRPRRGNYASGTAPFFSFQIARAMNGLRASTRFVLGSGCDSWTRGQTLNGSRRAALGGSPGSSRARLRGCRNRLLLNKVKDPAQR
jgi:hypothetical protein